MLKPYRPSSKRAKVVVKMVINFNFHYCYGEQKTILSELVVIIVMFFSTDTDIGSKYTDIYMYVRNNEHNFTWL